MRRIAVAGVMGCALIWSVAANAETKSTHGGRLLVIGGGLRPDNATIFHRFIQYAGGPARARLGILPTASQTYASSIQFAATLQAYGVPAERIQIIDLMETNAGMESFRPVVAAKIRSCTGVFMMGGDQQRIMRALVDDEGNEHPAWQALRDVVNRGGVLAGSSAGAAVQSDPMLRVAAAPPEPYDEGLDALDFGLASNPSRRGIQLIRGLGVFKAGVIDQHFSQYRGRLARLSRAITERHIRYGFGIDENTALDVDAQGSIDIVGTGSVTIIDSQEAQFEDGPLGCRLEGLKISCLQNGDRFDSRTGEISPVSGKVLLTEGREPGQGVGLISDIAARGAVYTALTNGLADNVSRVQEGVLLKQHHQHVHGYRYTFQKTDHTRSFVGQVPGGRVYTIVNARLDIRPVVSTLESPQNLLPIDLPAGELRPASEALWFRGILLADDQRRFRPVEALTRAELAHAVATSISLPSPPNPMRIGDVTNDTPLVASIAKTVNSQMLSLDSRGMFRPADPVTRQEVSAVLMRLAQLHHPQESQIEPVSLEDHAEVSEPFRPAVFQVIRAQYLVPEGKRFRPTAPVTRADAAAAFSRVLGLAW